MGEGRTSPGLLFSSSQMGPVPWAFPELPLVFFPLPGAAGGEAGAVGDTGEGREAVGRPGGRNPLGISGRAALSSHTGSSAQSLQDFPRRSSPGGLSPLCHSRGCSAEPPQPVLLCTLSSASLEVTVVNTFAAPLK